VGQDGAHVIMCASGKGDLDVANTYPDDVALLKQELAQFLLAEITSVQGASTFRREVGEQVAATIDQILDARLKPVLDRLERQAGEQARQTAATLDDALARLKAAAPAADAPAFDRQLSDVAAQLEELRQRLGRVEDAARPARGPAAKAQPMLAAGRAEAKLADERIAAPPAAGAALPRWLLLLLLLLVALSVLGLGNLYYERLTAPTPAQPVPVSRPAPQAAAPPSLHSDAQTALPRQAEAVSVPPQNPVALPSVTPTPAPPAADHAVPAADHAMSVAPAPAAQPRPRFPADFAIERGWMAAQPYAVEPRLARRVGSNDSLPTLKSIVCGGAPNCTSDALMADSAGGKQLIALQMLMAQIGDRFCTPRRSLAVTGLVSADGLAGLAAIARCAGGAPSRCSETQNQVCAPDADALQSGSQAARAALLRWALWKTGST
jgi:hypothetical protein